MSRVQRCGKRCSNYDLVYSRASFRQFINVDISPLQVPQVILCNILHIQTDHACLSVMQASMHTHEYRSEPTDDKATQSQTC